MLPDDDIFDYLLLYSTGSQKSNKRSFILLPWLLEKYLYTVEPGF